MTDTDAILLFVKQPARGQVKSRIAAVLGEDIALELYKNFILDIIHTIEETQIPFRVYVHPPDAIPAMSAWLAGDKTHHPQVGADLGQRMEQAFHAIFAENVERAILIGSDLPDLPIQVLREAMDALERHDAVIGPAQDGGYYLIGFRKSGFLPEIFRGIIWSRPDVFDRTRQIFQQARSRVHVLPYWQDVDTIEDLRDLMRRNERTAFAGGRTMRYLEKIRDQLFTTEGHHGKI